MLSTRQSTTSSFLVISLLFACNLSAQDGNGDIDNELADFYGDQEFVSIATGTQKLIQKAPAVASVITAKEIARMGATNLNEVLEQVPGVHVSISNLSRHDPVFSIRGIQTGFNPQVLVLLNGTEFKNSFNGGLPFIFYFPVHFIERIEIIRGPGSAIYGADAFSGVINIITKGHKEKAISMGAQLGSFNSSEFWLSTSNKKEDYAYSFSMEYFETDGDDSRVIEADLQSILDSIFLTTASLAPAPLTTNREVLNVFLNFQYRNWSFENWYWKQDKVGLGPGGAQAIDEIGYQSEDLYRFKAKYENSLFQNSSYSFDLSMQFYDQETLFVLLPPGTVVPVGADGNLSFVSPVGLTAFSDGVIGKPISKHEDTRANIRFNYNELESHKIRMEIGWLRQDLDTSEFKNFGPGVIEGTETLVDGSLSNVSNTPFVYITDTDRTASHLSIQDEWAFSNDWEATIGVRYDDYSDFGDAINPRAALVWQSSQNLTTKLLYGRAFRPPSFLERLLQNNPVSLGNPDLEQEEIDTVELAFDYRINFNSEIILTLYHYKAKNIIDVVADENATTRTYQNARDQKGSGYEITYDWDISPELKTQVNFSHQLTKAKSNFFTDDTYKYVADVPKNSIYLNISYQLNDNWSVSSQFYNISGRKRLPGDLRSDLSDYSNLNFSVQFMSDSQQWKIFLRGKNITGDDQREPSDGTITNDYPLEQERIWLGGELIL